MLKKRSLLGFTMVFMLCAGAIMFQGSNLYARQDLDNQSCPTCMKEKRKHIRGCLTLWGNFSAGEPGGFLATGSKIVCRNDENNSCDSEWLTGCVSKEQ
jgi:hypothetical protein